jgi:hypothetical protein
MNPHRALPDGSVEYVIEWTEDGSDTRRWVRIIGDGVAARRAATSVWAELDGAVGTTVQNIRPEF